MLNCIEIELRSDYREKGKKTVRQSKNVDSPIEAEANEKKKKLMVVTGKHEWDKVTIFVKGQDSPQGRL